MDFSPKTQQCVRFCPWNGLGSPHRESAPGRDARVEFYWCQAANVCRVPDEGEDCAGLRRGYWSKLEKEAALRAEEQRPGAPEPGRPPTRSLVSPRTPPTWSPGLRPLCQHQLGGGLRLLAFFRPRRGSARCLLYDRDVSPGCGPCKHRARWSPASCCSVHFRARTAVLGKKVNMRLCWSLPL